MYNYDGPEPLRLYVFPLVLVLNSRINVMNVMLCYEFAP